MPRRLLVAIDFSPGSRRALDAATALARDLDASLVLVHAFARPMHVPMDPEGHVDPLSEVQAEIELDEAVELTTEWASGPRQDGIDVEVVAREARARDLILEAAEDSDASLIVVGHHGWGAVKRFILGSVALDVAQRSRRPVLVVPEPGE